VTAHHAAILDLRSKYAQMLSMRDAHASGREDAASVRVQMAELAARFPGALREIDELELHEIGRRIAALDAVAAEAAPQEPWMEAMALFHAMTRGALAVKRWLAGRKRVDAALRMRLHAEAASLPFPEDARAWADELGRIASPPRGRLTEVVFARLALRIGTTPHAARRLVFGVPRRSR
jgi:hypothetical protein